MPDRSVLARWSVFISFLAGLSVFLWIHIGNFLATQRLMRSRATPGAPLPQETLFEAGVVALVPAAAGYLVYALAGWVIARNTSSKILWALPALITAFSPLPGALFVGEGPIVRTFGPFWPMSSWPLWLSASVDLALVCAPGAFAALLGPRSAPRRADGATGAALVMVGGVAVALYLMARYQEAGTFDVNIEAHLMLLVLFVSAAILGLRRPGAVVLMLVVALLASEAPWMIAGWFSESWRPGGWSLLRTTWEALRSSAPMMAAVAAGLLADPLARYLRVRSAKLNADPQPASA